MKLNMKILLIITGLGVGGAERQVIDLANSFSEKGHSVKIIFLTGNADLKNNKKSVILEKIEFKNNFALGLFNLCKKIKDFNPDIVHSHMFHANIISRICRLFISIPTLICTAHSNNEGGYFRMRAYQLTDWLCTISTNVSNDAVQAFENLKAVKKGRMITVYNGIDTEKFQPNNKLREKLRKSLNLQNNYVFLSVGRLVEEKDFPNLLFSFKKLIKIKNNARLVIAGDGPLKDQLINLCKDLGIENFTHFLGYRDDVQYLMNIADTFVLSSKWEGFGLVVAEAMLTEKIVVATDSGGVSEVMGGIGFISPIKNSNHFSQNMAISMDLSISEREFMKKESRKHIQEKFDLDKISNQWIEIYQRKILL